jgi:hypothetical protein
MLALNRSSLGVIGWRRIRGVIIYNGAGCSGIRNQILLFIALYVAVIVVSAAVSASLATRRNVLELLQTKE